MHLKLLIATALLISNSLSHAKEGPDLNRAIDNAAIVIRATDQNAQFFCEKTKKKSLIWLTAHISEANTYLNFAQNTPQVSQEGKSNLELALTRLKEIPCKK